MRGEECLDAIHEQVASLLTPRPGIAAVVQAGEESFHHCFPGNVATPRRTPKEPRNSLSEDMHFRGGEDPDLVLPGIPVKSDQAFLRDAQRENLEARP